MTNLALLELFSIVAATKIWGVRLCDRMVRFLCDNLGVAQALYCQLPTCFAFVAASSVEWVVA